MLHGWSWKRSVFFPISGTGSGGMMSCEHCSQEKAPADWGKVLNVLFRVSEEIPDRDEVESIYSEFPPRALTSRQPLSDFWAVSFHLPDVSLLTVTCSLECRGTPSRTETASLVKTAHGKTVGWGPFHGCQHRSDWGSSVEAAAAALTKCSPWQQRSSTAKCFALLIWYSTALTNQVSCLCCRSSRGFFAFSLSTKIVLLCKKSKFSAVSSLSRPLSWSLLCLIENSLSVLMSVLCFHFLVRGQDGSVLNSSIERRNREKKFLSAWLEYCL